MSVAPTGSREVPVEVLPPLPDDARRVSPPPAESGPPVPLSGFGTFYHPASGVVILGIDLLFFGPEVFLPFDLPVMCVLAFLATFPIVFVIQSKWSKNRAPAALGKAFLGAFLAGLPFSIVGGIFGAAVLALSGLPNNPVEAYKKITGGGTKPTA